MLERLTFGMVFVYLFFTALLLQTSFKNIRNVFKKAMSLKENSAT